MLRSKLDAKVPSVVTTDPFPATEIAPGACWSRAIKDTTLSNEQPAAKRLYRKNPAWRRNPKKFARAIAAIRRELRRG